MHNEDVELLNSFPLSHGENQRKLLMLKKDIIKEFKVEQARRQADLIMYATLFGAYKPNLWYWECVECMRRLSLTGLLVFMYPGSEKQVLICFFWMMIYSNMQPHLEPSHSFFMMSSQWGVLLQLYAVFLIINRSFDSSSVLIGWLAVAVGVIVFAYCMSSIGRVIWVKMRVSKDLSKNMELV